MKHSLLWDLPKFIIPLFSLVLLNSDLILDSSVGVKICVQITAQLTWLSQCPSAARELDVTTLVWVRLNMGNQLSVDWRVDRCGGKRLSDAVKLSV